jgi:hypothetical protein
VTDSTTLVLRPARGSPGESLENTITVNLLSCIDSVSVALLLDSVAFGMLLSIVGFLQLRECAALITQMTSQMLETTVSGQPRHTEMQLEERTRAHRK